MKRVKNHIPVTSYHIGQPAIPAHIRTSGHCQCPVCHMHVSGLWIRSTPSQSQEDWTPSGFTALVYKQLACERSVRCCLVCKILLLFLSHHWVHAVPAKNKIWSQSDILEMYTDTAHCIYTFAPDRVEFICVWICIWKRFHVAFSFLWSISVPEASLIKYIRKYLVFIYGRILSVFLPPFLPWTPRLPNTKHPIMGVKQSPAQKSSEHVQGLARQQTWCGRAALE